MNQLIDVEYGNGVVLKIDPTIKPGDIVTGYHKGYWIVDEVTPRGSLVGTIKYTRIDLKTGMVSKIKKSCDKSYCRKIDPVEHCQEMINEAERLMRVLIMAKDSWK